MIWDSWIICSILVSPKITNIGCGSHGHVRQVQEPWKWGVSGFPIMKSKSYGFKMKQNNYVELLIYSFHNIYSKNGPPDPPRPPNRIFSGFSQDFLYEIGFFFVLLGLFGFVWHWCTSTRFNELAGWGCDCFGLLSSFPCALVIAFGVTCCSWFVISYRKSRNICQKCDLGFRGSGGLSLL